MPVATPADSRVEGHDGTARIRRLPGDVALFVGPMAAQAEGVLLGPYARLAEFERDCGHADAATPDYLRRAAAAFFANGGRRLHLATVAARAGGEADAAAYAMALQASAALVEVAVVAAPGASILADRVAIEDALIAHVERDGLWRLLVLDPPPGLDPAGMGAWRARLDTPHAATYYPWITSGTALQPPSGFICGAYAANDHQHGIHRAPANLGLSGVGGFEHEASRADCEALVPLGINCLRRLPGRGPCLWGARTLGSDPAYRYVNVRRLLDQLQRSLARGLAWVAFEAQSEALWARVRLAIDDYLLQLWRDGALSGDRPDAAWFARCDRSTMTQADIDNGRLRCMVGVAVQRPGEFVTLRIALATATAVG